MDEIRISDIFKRNKPDKKESPPSPKDTPPPADVRLSSIYNQCVMPPTTVDAAVLQGLYDCLFGRITALYKDQCEPAGTANAGITEPVARICDYFISGSKDLLNLCSRDYAADEDFLFRHAANTSVLSVYTGIALGFERARVLDLGVTAAVHEMGMLQYRQIIMQKRQLTKDEYVLIRQHPVKGAEIAAKLAGGFSGAVIEAMQQEHERWDGTGYPKGLKGDVIHPYGQVLSLVDVYEAMLHARPWRSRHNSLDAIKTILENKTKFSGPALKVLIEGIGIFPVGMPVRLNTKEIGVIVKGNPKLPLRPVIDVLVDAAGNKLKNARQLDLADNTAVYIEECLEKI